MYREFDNHYFHSCDFNEVKQICCYFYSNFYMSFIFLICAYITAGTIFVIKWLFFFFLLNLST